MLNWHSGGGTRFVVARATNRSMTAGRYNYWLSAGVEQFTPYGLKQGTRYYYQVQARNYGAKSRWSRQVSG